MATLLISTLEPVRVIGTGSGQIMGGAHGQWVEAPLLVERANGATTAVRPDDLVDEADVDRELLARIEEGQRRVALEGRPMTATLGRPKLEAAAMKRGYEAGRLERLRR